MEGINDEIECKIENHAKALPRDESVERGASVVTEGGEEIVFVSSSRTIHRANCRRVCSQYLVSCDRNLSTSSNHIYWQMIAVKSPCRRMGRKLEMRLFCVDGNLNIALCTTLTSGNIEKHSNYFHFNFDSRVLTPIYSNRKN